MNTKILEEIGLTEGETKVYLALLKLKTNSTGPISKKANVSRSKIYSILDKLEKKGLVSHVDKNGVRYFQAAEPSRIKDYLEKKKSKIEELKTEFEEFLPELEEYQQSDSTTKVSFYQGQKGLETAHEHTYLKLSPGEEYVYLGVPKEQPKKQHRYWMIDHKRRERSGINCRLLLNRDIDEETLKNRNSYKGSDARLMPIDIITPSYFLIYKDTVMIAIPSQDPIAIEIVNQNIADAFMAYFEEFWKRTKKHSS